MQNNKGYNLYLTGWAGNYLVQNGSKQEAINAISEIQTELEARKQFTIMDENYILETPEGETYIDERILSWVSSSNCNEK